MNRLILPFLALLAVACSSGSQYERGTYTTPVRAPSFSPAEDAPHTRGQPGYVNGQRVQRSPNRRYAEPSREPQMMAGDGDSRRAVGLMFSEPVPEETPEGITDAEYAKCWKDIQKMMRNEREAILKFAPEEVRCMRNRVMSHCGSRKIEHRAGPEAAGAFEDYMADEENIKACGTRHQYWTKRVSEYMNRFNQFGDDVLGWRP